MDPVTEIFGLPADPGSQVSLRRAPDLAIFDSLTQPFERFAHDPESVFLVLQERVEEQRQVPAIPDDALQRRAQSPPETDWAKRLLRYPLRKAGMVYTRVESGEAARRVLLLMD